jgi:predicted amidohydrolase
MVKVRLLQVKSDETETVSVRIERVLAELPKHLKNVDLLVLPELWTIHAFDLESLQVNALSLDDSLFKRISEMAKSAKKWLHAGTFPIKNTDGTFTNTAVVFNPNGEIAVSYSKIHLFGFADGEQKYLSSGNEVVVTQTPLGDTGISTCYDLRFPELYREQVSLGATSFLISAGWPTVRAEHWNILLKARAIENQAFVIAACGRGTSNNTELAGQSIVIDPRGLVVAQATNNDEFVDAELDLALIDTWRSEFPVLLDRRDLHNL